MNKNNSHIDNLVREKLRNLSREPRIDDFENIMNKMESAQSSRKLIPWWFSVLILAVLSTGAYLLITNFTGAETALAKETIIPVTNPQGDKQKVSKPGKRGGLPVLQVSSAGSGVKSSVRKKASQLPNTVVALAHNPEVTNMEAFPFEEQDVVPAKSYVYFPSLLSHFGLVQYVIPDTAFAHQKRKIVYPKPYTYRAGYFSIGITVLSGQSSLDMRGNGYNHPSYNERSQKGYNAATAYGARILMNYNLRHLHLQFGVGYNEIAMSSSFRFNNRYVDSIPVYNQSGQRIGYKYTSAAPRYMRIIA